MGFKIRRRVRIGTDLAPLPPVRTLAANVRLQGALGFDDLWVPDHVRHLVPRALWRNSPMSRFIPDLDAFFDPTAVIARYAGIGRRMGTAVTDVIRRNPGDLARAWLSLHHLTHGNAVLGIGAGEAMNVDPLGLSTSRAASRLEDTLSALRAAFSANGEFVTHGGPFHSWKGASFPPVYRGTGPPIWVAAEGPRTCSLAGRYGDGWISFSDPDSWKTEARYVATGAAAAGREIKQMEWCWLALSMICSKAATLRHVCGSSPLVKALMLVLPGKRWASVGATHPWGEDFRGPLDYAYASDDAADSLFEGERFQEAAKAVTPDLVVELVPSGTAQQVAIRFAEQVENGVSHCIIVNPVASAGLDAARESFCETFKLLRALKRMAPGDRGWARLQK